MSHEAAGLRAAGETVPALSRAVRVRTRSHLARTDTGNLVRDRWRVLTGNNRGDASREDVCGAHRAVPRDLHVTVGARETPGTALARRLSVPMASSGGRRRERMATVTCCTPPCRGCQLVYRQLVILARGLFDRRDSKLLGVTTNVVAVRSPRASTHNDECAMLNQVETEYSARMAGMKVNWQALVTRQLAVADTPAPAIRAHQALHVSGRWRCWRPSQVLVFTGVADARDFAGLGVAERAAGHLRGGEILGSVAPSARATRNLLERADRPLGDAQCTFASVSTSERQDCEPLPFDQPLR